MKVLVACGAGMGTSQMIKLRAGKVMKELGVQCDMTHTSIEEARSMARGFDLIIVNERFVETLPAGLKIVGLKNILDEKEMKTKILAVGIGNE